MNKFLKIKVINKKGVVKETLVNTFCITGIDPLPEGCRLHIGLGYGYSVDCVESFEEICNRLKDIII